jgi:hypothetical protein
MYLVMLIHAMDDLPLGLFTTKRQAERFAESVEPQPSKQIRDLYGTDCSNPCKVDIVKFTHGLPVKCWTVKTFY